jgi:undecaprenyl phosphate-alpha-L-ara4N flippase subunit ArnF
VKRSAATRSIGIGLMVCSIALSAAGQLCMKAGMQALHQAGGADLFASFGLASLDVLRGSILWTGAGLAAYALSLAVWLAVLVRYPLSFAYPLLSLSYVLVYIGATHWARLMEPATPLRTAGTLLILAGVALVSLTERPASRRGTEQK